LFDRFTPKFVKRYVDLHTIMLDAFIQYRSDVEQKCFPGVEHTIEMPESEWTLLNEILNEIGEA